MAYAFDRIDRYLKKKEPESVGLEKSYPVSSSNFSASGENLSNAGVTPSSSNVPQRNLRFKKQASATAAYEAARKNARVPGVLGSLSGDIQTRRAELERGAREFGEAERRRSREEYETTPQNVSTAIRHGNEGTNSRDYNRIHDILGRRKPRELNSPNLPETDISEVEYVTSGPGIRDLYRKKGSSSYTPGMAEFDLGVLRGSPNYSNKISKLISDYKSLRPEIKALYDKELAESSKFDKEFLAKSQEDIRKYLESEGKTLTEDQIKDAQQMTELLKSIYAGKHKKFGELERRLYSELFDALGKEEFAKLTSGRRKGNKNLLEVLVNRYNRGMGEAEKARMVRDLKLSYGPNTVFKPSEMYDPQEKKMFDRIMFLLGKGERAPKYLVERDLPGQIKYNEGRAKELRDEILRGELEDIKGYEKGWREARDFKSTMDDQKGFREYLGNNKDEISSAIYGQLDRLRKHTGKNFFLDFKKDISKQFLTASPQEQKLMIDHLSKTIPGIDKYLSKPGNFQSQIMGIPDQEFSKFMVDAMMDPTNDSADKYDLSETFHAEGARNPLSKDDFEEKRAYMKALGQRPLDGWYGTSLFLSNPGDPRSDSQYTDLMRKITTSGFLGTRG